MPARGDQSDVIAFLSSPEAHDGAPVEVVETHSACVFLSGEHAYKLKRQVRYDFLDFSTLDRRREACEAEVRLNRRTAPRIYLRAAPVTRDAAGRLAIDGGGDPVEWLVVMRRFDEDGLLDRLAARGALPLSLVPPLAGAVARMHADADIRPDHGGAAGMSWVVDRNAIVFDELAAVLPPDTAARVTDASRRAIARHAALLEARREGGRVRQCHGDLHLRNVVLDRGELLIFDAIEFNDRIACTDVLYDLAFLVMDLLRSGLPAHASAVVNRYLDVRDEHDGLALMPLFLSARAAVRAKVTAIEAGLAHDPDQQTRDRALARVYLDDAETFLRPVAPRLVAIGGHSGTGKSTLAARLAPGLGAAPGALVLRSDVLRKRLFGMAPEARLGPDGYTAAVSASTYADLDARAGTALDAGWSVIADARFADAAARAAIEKVARDRGVSFDGLWLDAAPDVLRARVEARGSDASDADRAVVDRQLARPIGPVAWTRIDAGESPDATERRSRAVLGTPA